MPKTGFDLRVTLFRLILFFVFTPAIWATDLPENQPISVRTVIDGDTLIVAPHESVRLSSINTPELGRDGQPDQPLAEAARRYLEDRIGSQPVLLQFDREQKDHYGRWLAHVFLPDGTHLNRELVEAGLATLSLHPPNLRYQESLRDVQRRARSQQLGIWGDMAYGPWRLGDAQPVPNQKWGRYCVTLQRIERLEAGTRLWFSNWVYGWVPARFRDGFDAAMPQTQQDLEIQGWLSRRGDKRFILLRHPTQLIVPADSACTAAPVPGQTAPGH